jgi:hypothetical protein
MIILWILRNANGMQTKPTAVVTHRVQKTILATFIEFRAIKIETNKWQHLIFAYYGERDRRK